MASEYLERTPTSSGNRKVFTLSAWVKNNNPAGTNQYLFGAFSNGSNGGYQNTICISDNEDRANYFQNTNGTVNSYYKSGNLYRDAGNWTHICTAIDTTEGQGVDRAKIYINGVRNKSLSITTLTSEGHKASFNTADVRHMIGNWPGGGTDQISQLFDLFWVDGQALTPDVFGFFKDGDGYQSSGTTNATDFRPGQWSPRAPKSIKYTINRSGGFGANGFYLPMNDSSNPGADFHCAPNSIITLKGEDLPQPRNGAPTTTDAYVSQLRTQTGELFNDGIVNFTSTNRNALQDSGDAINFGTGEFTVEAFVYHTDIPQNALQYIFMNTAQSNTNTFAFAVESDRIIAGAYAGSFSNTTKVEATFPVGSLKVGQWYHYAACRSGNTLRLFIDGRMVVEDTSHTENYDNTSAFGCRVGCEAGAGATAAGYKAIKGFISNVRVVNGTALYTSNFTPPTSALTAVNNTVLLCCQSPTSPTAAAVSPGTLSVLTEGDGLTAARNELDASIILACPFITGGFGQDGAVSSTIPGLGDYHIALGGPSSIPAVNFLIGSGTQAQVTGDKGLYYGSSLDVTSNTINPRATVGTAFTPDGDYTVEFWAYQNDLTDVGGAHLVQYDQDNGNTGWLISSDLGTFRWMLRNTSNQDTQVNIPNVVKTGQWNHFAGVYESSKNLMTAYLNGVAVGSTAVADNYLSTQYTSLNRIHIGSNGGGGSRPMLGYMSDLRIYKGVAKYKGGFDVSKPYTPVGIEPFRTTADTCKNNFATWNPLTNHPSVPITLTNGSLTMTQANTWRSVLATHGVSSGKWYYEMKTVNDSQYLYIGWGNSNANVAEYPSEDNNAWAMRIDEPKAYHDQTGDNTQVSFSGGFTQNDICGCAFDADNGRIWWSKNGTWLQGDPATGASPVYDSEIPTGVTYHPMAGVYTETAHTNFGQNPSFSGTVTAGTNADGNGKGLFKYAPPSGFLALCEDNVPTPAIADPGKYFKAVLYEGDSASSRSITGVGFKPDFVWIKKRAGGSARSNQLFDSVRGGGYNLHSDSTGKEDFSTTRLLSFDDDGFSISDDDGTNASNGTYVAWCWQAGVGTTSLNTDGAINSVVSVNQDAGFSIISYTGTGSNTTVGHGLTITPNVVICKNRIDDSTNWSFNGNVAGLVYGKNKMVLQGSGNIVTDTNEVMGAGTSILNLGTSSATNDTNDAMIAYCWHSVDGFSKMGGYVGNGDNDGPFVYCGFKPAWVLIKKTDGSGTENWRILDSSRSPFNQNRHQLLPSSSNAESIETGLDLVSNGFKIRDNDAHMNQDGTTYFFMAFAESPFQTANAK